MDMRKEAFRRFLPEDWSGQKVVGYGFDRDSLEEAGIARADALAAVTNGDNSNILSARIARETYEVENVVARIYDPRRATIYRRLGIPTVATVTWTTDQVRRRLFPELSAPEWTSSGGEVSLVERALPATWAGRRLAELDRIPGVRVVTLSRGNETRISSDEIGQEGDILHLAVTRSAGEELLERRLADPDAPGARL